MNALLGQKISIVTPKPADHSPRVLGILSSESFQVIFLDTPGIITPRYALQESMMVSASAAIDDADVIVLWWMRPARTGWGTGCGPRPPV